MKARFQNTVDPTTRLWPIVLAVSVNFGQLSHKNKLRTITRWTKNNLWSERDHTFIWLINEWLRSLKRNFDNIRIQHTFKRKRSKITFIYFFYFSWYKIVIQVWQGVLGDQVFIGNFLTLAILRKSPKIFFNVKFYLRCETVKTAFQQFVFVQISA